MYILGLVIAVLVMIAPTRPIMRYHGGKWRLATWIIGHFSEHRIYVEPFGGAGSVLLRKPRSFAEVYNDLDGDIVNVFRVLRDPLTAEQLRRALILTPWSRREFYLSYEPTDDPVEQARRTLARQAMAFGTTSRKKNRTGFRAKAYRSNQTGAVDWATYPRMVPAFVDRLRGVTIESRPARDVIMQNDSTDTLFYLDPPYPHSTRTAWKGHNDCTYTHEMSDQDHRQLAWLLRQLRGKVLVSGYPCDLYDMELYADWHRVERAALADGARERTEVIWMNTAAAAALKP